MLVRAERRFGWWLVPLALAACLKPPPPPAPVAEYRSSADIATTASRVTSFMVDHRIPVTSTENGVIGAREVALSWEQLRTYANCGGSGSRTVQSMNDNEMRAKNIQAHADVMVYLRAEAGATLVRPAVNISATWSNRLLNQQSARFECVSNGALEKQIADALKAPERP